MTPKEIYELSLLAGELKSLCGNTTTINGEKLLLLRPEVFMNNYVNRLLKIININ